VKTFVPFALALSLFLCTAQATVEEALSYALQAAQPYVKEGFTIREDYWGGDLPVKQPKAIVQQLFKGNEYWFWMGTDVANAKISVHVYDAEGQSGGSGIVEEQTAHGGGPGCAEGQRLLLSDRRD